MHATNRNQRSLNQESELLKIAYKVKPNGFTLIEMMVTIAVLAILAAIAAPSIDQQIRRTRLDADTERMQSSIAYARSEAIKRASIVSLVPHDDNYGQGWKIITDNSAVFPNCKLDTSDGETTLRVQQVLPPTTQIGIGSTKVNAVDCSIIKNEKNQCISFNQRGKSIGTNGELYMLTLCLQDSKAPSNMYKVLTMNKSGETYLVKSKN